ncbi:aspartate-semialdehyde dehydrogenase [Nannochloropsis gaditana]|uniref:aspartate-semialdehyde dehydrogenase n=1 Tax=Nannochloropsis gaditana TaxID=72520 RepID=W7TSS0_9STRA|nr:aspartate-semialdehyde dehydrogenase [Nannochloropsis gaditana]
MSSSSSHHATQKVGVVGATGAVGAEMIKVLKDRRFPVTLETLRLFASERSAGKTLSTPYGEKKIELFSVEAARECDFVFLAVSGTFALQYAKKISEKGGPYVIDNSSAFRYDDDIPLVVPEINAAAIGSSKLIANPNCTTAIAVMALWPLHRRYGIKRLLVSTYQAASGAGQEGMEELRTGMEHYLIGRDCQHQVFAHPLPFNVIPHIDKFQENGYTKEEMKVAWETRKIFDYPHMEVSCTAVRVPTLRAHAEALTIETYQEIEPSQALLLLQEAPGVEVRDDGEKNLYPMPLTATGKYEVEVGRVRQSLVFGRKGLDMFVCGDQLLRGAASNAVFIAEAVLSPDKYGVGREGGWGSTFAFEHWRRAKRAGWILSLLVAVGLVAVELASRGRI